MTTEEDSRWFVESDPNMDDEDTVVTPLPARLALGIPQPMPPIRTEEIEIDVVDEDADLPPILEAPAVRLLPSAPARTRTPPPPDHGFSQLNTIIGVMRSVLAERPAPVSDFEIDAVEWHVRERIAKL